MCFSATASFTAAGITGAIGLATLSRVRRPRNLAMAAMPLVFAVQQGVEGLIWLNLMAAPDPAGLSRLSFWFLMFAQVIWPAFAPLAVWLIEPDARRRRAMAAILALGVALSLYFFWGLMTRPHSAAIEGEHVVYQIRQDHLLLVGAAYLTTTGLSLAISTLRPVALTGAIIMLGCAVAYTAYWVAIISVWCFFAAIASLTLLWHFERIRRRGLLAAAPI